jgi:hypothetical protein
MLGNSMIIVHFYSESRFLLVMAHRSESSSSASGTTSSSAATNSGTHAVSDGGCGHERGCKRRRFKEA